MQGAKGSGHGTLRRTDQHALARGGPEAGMHAAGKDGLGERDLIAFASSKGCSIGSGLMYVFLPIPFGVGQGDLDAGFFWRYCCNSGRKRNGIFFCYMG